MLAGRLEQYVGALHVRDDERLRAADRAIDVRLGGEVDDRLDARDRVRDRVGVLDRAVHEADLPRHVLQVLAPARVGELVEHATPVAVLADAQPHESRADEARAAADEQLHRDPTVTLM